MLFNKNIVLEILRSNFSEEITSFVYSCVTELYEFELDNIFESTVDFAVLDTIDEMIVNDYSVEEEDDRQTVEGSFEVLISVDGYECINGDNIYKESGIVNFGIGFTFSAENKKYSNIDLEYLY